MSGALCAVLVVTFVFFARGWIGGGDAKLAAATALWLGFDQLLNYLIFASILGGVLTIADHALPPDAAAGPARQPGMGEASAPRWTPACLTGSRSRSAALRVYPDTLWMKSLGM